VRNFAIFYLGTFLNFTFIISFKTWFVVLILHSKAGLKSELLVADLATFQAIGRIYLQASGHSVCKLNVSPLS
jgi:hypothetical protein